MSAKFTWRQDPLRFIGHVEGMAKKRALDLSRSIYDGIVERTPVDTGSLRASWRASLNSPDYSRVTNERGNPPLLAPTFPLREIPLLSKVFISNTTPYVIPIEYGWSKQAPAGMVRVTLAKFGISLRVRG